MGSEINTPIDVLVAFSKEGKHIKPRKFFWKNEVHRIQEVSYTWDTSAGNERVHHYSVFDQNDNLFELRYHTTQERWILYQMYFEEP